MSVDNYHNPLPIASILFPSSISMPVSSPKADPNALRIGGHCLCEPSKAASFFKMRIHDHIINKPKTRGDFYFAFQMGLGGIAFVDHCIAHCHGACTGAGYNEIFLLITDLR